MPDNLPPVLTKEYNDRERAMIAGYLIGKRAGVLKALASVSTAPPGTTEGWAEGNTKYYQDAERYSRFLLHWIGYSVGRNQNYEP